MRILHVFRPAPESLEGRALLRGGAAGSWLPAQPVATGGAAASTAGDVFAPQMGDILTAADVSQAHLSRSEIGAIVTHQIERAYSAFGSGLSQALSGLATGGDGSTFEGDIHSLCDGLSARCTAILSTSPRAASSLVPSLQVTIDGSGPNSLDSRLSAISIDVGSFDASRSGMVSVAQASRQVAVAAIGKFTQDPAFAFSGGGGSAGGGSIGGGSIGGNSLRAAPAAPAAVTAAASSNTAINVSWAYVPGATGYLIERSPDGADWAEIARVRVGNNDTYSDTGLTPDTTYFYRVRAANAGGFSDPSPYATAVTSLAPPDAPASFYLNPINDPHGIPLAMHIHPRLTIIINGQQQTIPAYIGLTYPGGSSDPNSTFTAATPIHTHDASGYLHVESTQVYTFRLSDVFDIWSHYAGGQGHPVSDASIVFTSQDLLGHLVDATHQITMTVNGQPSTLFGNLALNDPNGTLFSQEGDPSNLNIVITYGPISGS
jgi:hypothetical protein